MIKKPYNNSASQRERRSVLRNDAQIRTGTYHAHATSEFDVPRGRFSADSKSEVIGSKPTIDYPMLRMPTPWDHDPVEPPFPVNISEPIIVGEPFEVERSLREMRDGAVPPSASLPDSPNGDGQRSAGAGPFPASSAPSPPRKRRRRR